MSLSQPFFRIMEFETKNLARIIDLALQEDIGDGDITTLACVEPSVTGNAEIICKSGGVLAGQTVVRKVFERVDESLQYAALVTDGSKIEANSVVSRLTGSLASILTAERTALNFLMRLSGIATLTNRFVREIAGTGATILDTRKTTPGLREMEKYAVLCGGGTNHRKGLYDMILIKDNHIRAAGSVPAAVRKCLDYVKNTSHQIPIEVETKSGSEIGQALESGATWIMLDNMDIAEIRQAIEMIRKRSGDVKIEVSGGVTITNVREFAESGVDFISIGALTHSAVSLDFSLNIMDIT